MEYCQLHSTPDPLPKNIPAFRSPKHTRHSAKHTTKRQSYPSYASFFLDESRQDLKALISFLQRPETEPQEEEVRYYVNILKDQQIFGEFSQDLKVLTLLIENLKVKTISENECLYSLDKQDQNLYKVLKGEVLVKKPNQRAGRGKGKGEFVEQPQDFRISKNIEAYARKQCILLAITFKHYQQAVELSNYNKKIIQMLSATSLLSSLRRKELAYLLENTQEVNYAHKEALFREGADSNHNCFFIIQGQLIILKQSTEKSQVVCTVGMGNFIGEQALFDEVKRTYTASINSNNAKILIIDTQAVQKMIEHFKINKEKILGVSYRSYLQVRRNHYNQQIQDSLQIKDSFHQVQRPVKMSPIKQKHILNILRDIQNNSSRLDIKEKLIEKRYKLSVEGRKEASIITVDNPLFVRQDFPGLRRYVKRCNIFESRAREGFKLPSLL